jgi:hypothetical protein
MTNPAVLVTGHSFVQRLEKWLVDESRSTIVLGRQVFFEGAGGAKIHDLERMLPNIMARRHYDCVVVDIGSNDVCEFCATPDVVAGGVYQLGRCLKDEYGVTCVVLHELLRREKVNRWLEVSLPEYNERVEQINTKLKNWCTPDSGLLFRLHRANAKRLGDDGVHIRNLWMDKYWRSVMAGIVKALSQLQQ